MTETWRNETNSKANGGTELMMSRLYESLGEEFLSDFQIVPGRVRTLDDTKHRILWCHDLAEDPENHHLANEGWKRFHKIVFVSHWQAQKFIELYKIPWSRTVVLRNAIYPIDVDLTKKTQSVPETINVVYHTTPHRGLDLLVPAFEAVLGLHENIHLHVYSSFGVYGWEQRDQEHKDTLEAIDNHEHMTYHKHVSNDEIRKVLPEYHIFAYPSIWLETSCISLMEAMSAGLLCVHPNFGALYETASNWTLMYGFDEDRDRHISIHAGMLSHAISMYRDETLEHLHMKLGGQKTYADLYYNWDIRKFEWQNMLTNVKAMPLELEKPTGEVFSYRIGPQ